MKENSAPQEYGFMFICIINILVFVILIGLLNLIVGHNILNRSIVILVSFGIVGINYFILLKDKKYVTITKTLKN